jgi:mannose-6-phosphate isomerase
MARSVPPAVLRFEPLLKRYLWGGRRLGDLLGKPIGEATDYAESWELVDRPDGQSIVAEGPLRGESLGGLMARYGKALTGVDYGVHGQPGAATQLARFPLLLKYLDAEQVLSVQVHPDDAYARRMPEPDLGKTEAWYVVEARPGACLYAGLRPGITALELRQAIEQGRVEGCLHRIEPQAGDCIYIPAGTVHALGAGLVIAEIQQASNTTFRLYDWQRADAEGRPRPLHIAQALEVIDFDRGPVDPVVPQPTSILGRERLVDCTYFRFDRLVSAPTPIPVGGEGAFEILTCVRGSARLSDGSTFELGQTVLLTAAAPKLSMHPSANAVILSCRPPA